jgi:sugar diacid utilization regulator
MSDSVAGSIMLTGEDASQLTRFTILVRIVRTLTSELDVDDLIHGILQGAVEVLPAVDAGTLYMYREDRDELVPTDAVGLGPSILQMAIRPGEGMTGKAFSSQRGRLYEDRKAVQADANDGAPENLDAFYRASGGIPFPQSAITAPLVYKGKALGVLVLENLQSQHAFLPFDLELADALAQSAAVAIVNARLYESEHLARTKLEVLNAEMIKQHEQLERRLQVQKSLADVVREGLGGSMLAARLAGICGSRTVIVDSLYRIRAAYPDGASTLRELFPQQWEQVVGMLRSMSRTRRPGSVILSDHAQLLLAPVLVGLEVFGYVLVEILDRQPTDMDSVAVESAALIAVADFLKESDMEQAEVRRRDDLLQQLLNGRALGRIEAPAGMSPPLHIAVAALRVIGADDLESRSRVLRNLLTCARETFDSWQSRTSVTVFQERVVVIWGHLENPHEMAIRASLRAIVELMKRTEPDWSVAFCVSELISELGGLPVAFQTTRLGSEIRESLKKYEPVSELAQLGAYRFILTAASGNEATIFVKGVLGNVQTHDADHGTELLKTLRCLLDHGLRIRDTARQLGVHHHTVQYRLESIEQLTGLDAHQPADRLTLELAARLLAVAES